ncbi:hypothetical protein EHH54_32610 [Rhizobium leguminosarum]|nr:hypothetical protein EHH54_32610 [Rhizobium leguminosarum]TAW02577.1 hypothetical protein ELI25_36750 [Rhizobium ruizarguesonis]TAY60716.1 hypothetical protein ELH84_36815 [Rhizobium ruizarguesonis]TAZ53601.1 hypothetical protein ELH76_21705 [Rhizobium ruizarguesonis]
MNAFCASENCDAFIVFRSFPSQENAPENSNQYWSSLKGSDQGGRLPCLMERRNDEQFRTCRRRRSHQSMRKRCISLP